MVKTAQPAKPYVVVTNDDSVDSPLLAILIDVLKNDNDLLIVAPAQEQSWKGKSMTRRGVLKSKRSILATPNVGRLTELLRIVLTSLFTISLIKSQISLFQASILGKILESVFH